MSHQVIRAYDSETEEYTKVVDIHSLPIRKAWAIGHYGNVSASDTSQWRQNGDVSIRELPEGAYLECRIADTPFLSIVADEDQWGTWYTLKLGAPDGGLRMTEDGELVYGQEWGTPSFLKALGTALIEFADSNEARTGPYAHTNVVSEIAAEE